MDGQPQVRRWEAPWTLPAGSRPDRAPGEPGVAQLAALHVAVASGLSSLDGALSVVAGTSPWWSATAALAVAVGLGVAGLGVVRRPSGLARWLADLLLAAAVLHLFGAGLVTSVALGGDGATPLMVGALAALPVAAVMYRLHRRLWLQVVTAAALALALTSALARAEGMPVAVPGAFLLIVAAFTAAGAHLDVVRPVRSGYVVAALLAVVGAQVLLSGELVAGYLVAPAVLALVCAAVVRSRSASLLPVTLLAGVVIVPQLLGPVLGTGYTIGLTGAGVGAGVSWLAADVARRSPRPVKTGGVFAACTVLVVACAWPLSHADDLVVRVSALAALAVFLCAAVSARRIPAAVIAGLVLVARLPAVGTGSDEPSPAGALTALAVAVVASVACVLLLRRAPGPAAGPVHLEQVLADEGGQWTVVAPYAQVFDAVAGVLAGAGLPLQLVDRAAGRVVAGPALAPVLVVALWAADPVRTHVRAVGEPSDVRLLQQHVQARLGSTAPVPPA